MLATPMLTVTCPRAEPGWGSAVASMPLRDAFGQRQRLVMIERAGHHHELFAAYPRGELASALSVAVQDRCDLLQTGVAGRMAEQIVVFLEVIHIDHQQAQLRALPAPARNSSCSSALSK